LTEAVLNYEKLTCSCGSTEFILQPTLSYQEKIWIAFRLSGRTPWPAPCGCEQHEWEPPRVTTEKVPYRRQKLQALGNAVLPVLVEVIGHAIMEVEKCRPNTYQP